MIRHDHKQHIVIDLSQSQSFSHSLEMQRYVDHMFLALSKLLPPGLLFGDSLSRTNALRKELPLAYYALEKHVPSCLTLSILSFATHHQDFTETLQYMLRYQLIPGKILYLASFSHCYFHFPDDTENRYYLAEAQIILRNEFELEKVETLLLYFIDAIKASIQNIKFSQHILGRQRSWEDPFSANVQEKILRVINKGLVRETSSLLDEMSGLLLFCDKAFKKPRTPQHFARIICSAFRIKKTIEEERNLSHTTHHLSFRFIPTILRYTFGKKRVVGLCIGSSELGDYEMFHERHILSAIRFFLPEARVVHGSYFHFHRLEDSTHIHYLEIESENSKPINLNSLKEMRPLLQEKLHSSVEHVTPMLFMRRNEEEIMKHIFTLSSELTTLNDLPQVMISFESQSYSHLTFTVILVRILKKDSILVQDALEKNPEKNWKLVLEKTYIVSYVQEHPKEANIFNLKIEKTPAFLRANSSINLYEARQQVVHFLAKKFGPIRDYMGGLIDCQRVLSMQLKHHFDVFAHDFPDVIEDFFYSITPIESQATLTFAAVRTLFENFLTLTKSERSQYNQYLIKKSNDQKFVYAMIRIPTYLSNKNLRIIIKNLTPPLGKAIYTKFQYQGFIFLGLIQNATKEQEKQQFFTTLEQSINESIRSEQRAQALRLILSIPPLSLDPRISMDPSAYLLSRLLFEGLMRLDSKGASQYAIAKKYSLTADRKTYTFTLRHCTWSDGDPVTAHDFVYAWRKILSPTFSTPVAYLLYPIKNARKAKMEKLPLDAVGIQAVDDKTLRVELEHPTPYFLELVASPLYYPIKSKIDDQLPDWAFRTHPEFVSNGPFTLEKSIPGKRYAALKNTRYWDTENVRLNRITLTVAEGSTGLKMFRQGKIDWLGRPTCPWETSFESCDVKMQNINFPSFLWLMCNIHTFPLTNRKFRQALSWAINRQQLTRYLPIPALPISTLFLKNEEQESFQFPPFEGDPSYAKQLFRESLEEIQLNFSKPLTLTLFHSEEHADIRHPSLLEMQRQFKQVLNISLNIEVLPWNQLSSRIINSDYQLCILSWHQYINTPFVLFDAFKYPSRNFYYKWENFQFQQALDTANRETNEAKRQQILNMAEEILLKDAPIIPLLQETGGYVKNPRLKGGDQGENAGVFDFKQAYFELEQERDQHDIHWL